MILAQLHQGSYFSTITLSYLKLRIWLKIKSPLIWIPAHAGDVHPHLTNVNEVTHSVARELVNRAGDCPCAPAGRDRLTRYNDLAKSFYLERRTLPTPHRKLNRAQVATLRLLQTNTYPSLTRYHIIYPDIYPSHTCKICTTQSATLAHMLW